MATDGLPNPLRETQEPRYYGWYGMPADHHLPVVPLWRGLLIDTALWTVGFSGALAALGRGRQRWRIRWGLCAICGYRLAGTSGARCPECGGEVRPQGTS